MTDRGNVEERRRHLADAVSRRRAVLGYAMDKLPHGPREATLRSIETAAEESYRRKTLVNLDRSLGWKIGTSEGVLDGSVAPPTHEDADVPTLSDVLLGLGVGTQWQPSALEIHSLEFGEVRHDEWQSMIQGNFTWSLDKLDKVAKTLSSLGENVTADALLRAMEAGTRPKAGHIPPLANDVQSAVKALLPKMSAADKVRAVLELAQSLAADLPTQHPSETSRARSADDAH